jgi:GH15 family glucan-1,4-alpha-glucosidase
VSRPIEEYAMIGDRHTAALVAQNGSIDWLCVPRFDSGACFAALLGDDDNGHWQLCPVGDFEVSRAYVENSAALQTTFTTDTGVVTLLDVMPTGDDRIDVVRRITGVRGTVRMRHEWVVRFDYGSARPWVRRRHEETDEPAITAVVGPDKLVLRGPRLPRASDHRHVDEFEVRDGEILTFSMTWLPSHLRTPPAHRAHVDETIHEEVTWVARLDLTGVPHADVVRRSLLTLHLLTHEETGGIVAAPTTSLPEDFGGERNWDYRYCWLRDAALTISALIEAGATDEARFWRDWLLRAVAGDPGDLQIMYAVDGARHLPELELDDLSGYAGSKPVRIGNGAVDQKQTDVIGEVMLALESARDSELGQTEDTWNLQQVLIDHLADTWDQKDNGLWEIRGELRHFTHSRVMVWAAFDRAVRAVEKHGLDGDVARWRELRDRVREEVMTKGFDRERNTFRQHYDTSDVDAALLMLPLVGFIDGRDPRMVGTIEAIEHDLMRDGLLLRYRTGSGIDGLSGDEHPFLACSFWLVSAYAGAGRRDDAHALFDRLVGLTNDVGLLSEEYDPGQGRMAGNFPQAFSHLALVQAAFCLRD